MNFRFVCLLFVVIIHVSHSFDPLFQVPTLAFDFVTDLISDLYCSGAECCNKQWIPNDLRKLKQSLTTDVFGQELAVSLVYNQIAAHVKNTQSSKALVLSLHGWTGGGKNHVASITAHSLYKKGMMSKFVHHFMAEVHFPHPELKHTYQDRLRDWVKGNVSQCPQSFFIFDEVDRMPAGILDGIKTYLDHHDNVDGVNYRRSIFVLISNSGAAGITNKTLQAWRDGKVTREKLNYQDFETVLAQEVFNQKGGLFQSNLIDHSLVDLYVPFLPLEQRHVKQCAEKEFLKNGHIPSAEDLKEVIEAMDYYPKDLQLYSRTGCKKVAAIVGRYLIEKRHGKLFS